MLTPLERELLTSVEELTSTCERSISALRQSEKSLKECETLLLETSKIMSIDLVHCVLALARSQQDLLTCWNASLSEPERQSSLNEALMNNWDTLSERLNALNAFAHRLNSEM